MDTLTALPWTWFGIRASGVVAWGLLTAVVLWGLLVRTRVLGRFAAPARVLDLHRWLGALALGFLAVHLGLLLVDPAVRFTVPEMLVPGLAPWQPFAVALGTLALWAMVPASVLGRLLGRMRGTGAAWFRRAHLVSYAAWPLATAHYVLAGTDARAEWSVAALVAGSALLAAALVARACAPEIAKVTAKPRTAPAPAPARVPAGVS